MSLGANSTDARDRAYVLHPNTDARLHEETGALEIVKGDGVYVIDADGKRYMEALSGLWCAGLGFSESRLVEAAYKQMKELPYYHLFTNKVVGPAVDLAEKLIEIAPVPMKKVFFTSSGSEANDTAIKFIWYRSNAMGRPQKKKIIGRRGGFHGVTMAAASLTGLPMNHGGFDLPLPGFLHVSKPHFWREAQEGETEEAYADRLAAELEALIEAEGADTIAAFWAEPIMGAGGVVLPPATYFAKIQAILKKHDILLVADEVICGFGRTGNMWGSTTCGMTPDIIVCSKQLSSAYMPIAAILMSDHVYQPIADGSHDRGMLGHGLTAGGHPVSTAVALETLRIIEGDNLVARAADAGARLQAGLSARLKDHPLVGEFRGTGLIYGIEMVADRATKAPWGEAGALGRAMTPILQEKGIILRLIGDTIGICPPLIISDAEVDLLVAAIGEALDELAAKVAA